MKVLFASSEVWPLMKTGGLADVAYSLPQALHKQGIDVRIVLPAYRDVLQQIDHFEILGWLSLSVAGATRSVRVLQIEHQQFAMPVWLIDCPQLFERPGNPYINEDGYDWPDNAERFALFSLAVARLGMDAMQIGWKPDVVHSNDWQTGMVPVFLDDEAERPRRVFTIHNMAYGGHFSQEEFNHLQLASKWWSSEGLEFYGNFSMLKGGLVYSDMITTVSPTYADEICTPAFGYGMDGVLSSRRYKLKGILNGIDTNVWNPASDPMLHCHFTVQRRKSGKQCNKQALLESFGASASKENLEAPLLGMVSRLVEQKGVDMVVEAIPHIVESSPANFVIIGRGHPHFEAQLLQLSQLYPGRVNVRIDYSEQKAHLLEAGADIFLMPSRFEPCGLNQLYSLRYGTIPIVHRTGGLADTVVDVQFEHGPNEALGNISENLSGHLFSAATGFVFDLANASELIKTIQRALLLFSHKKHWNQLQRAAMQQDFGWEKSATEYIKLYRNEA